MKTHRKVCFSNENAVMCSGERKQKVWAKDFPRFGSLVETKTNSFYLLHPNISIHTLHTFFYTFPLVLTRRICLTIKAFYVGDQFLYFHDLNE